MTTLTDNHGEFWCDKCQIATSVLFVYTYTGELAGAICGNCGIVETYEVREDDTDISMV